METETNTAVQRNRERENTENILFIHDETKVALAKENQAIQQISHRRRESIYMVWAPKQHPNNIQQPPKTFQRWHSNNGADKHQSHILKFCIYFFYLVDMFYLPCRLLWHIWDKMMESHISKPSPLISTLINRVIVWSTAGTAGISLYGLAHFRHKVAC